MVKAGRVGRGIILTTHSMQEAEVLCDRLGIFVDGRLVCIGPPKEIAARYGKYLVRCATASTCDREYVIMDRCRYNTTSCTSLVGTASLPHVCHRASYINYIK